MISTHASHGVKVLLLVEDNGADVRLMKEAFRESNIVEDISVVTDGEEAMMFLHRTGRYEDAPRPSLILLDLNLPRKDGRQVLSEIKSDPGLRRIPVIILTSSQAEEDILMTYDLGANCFITKPLDFVEFTEITRLLADFWLGVVRLPEG
jgi:CheY-like chemotaxis protein